MAEKYLGHILNKVGHILIYLPANFYYVGDNFQHLFSTFRKLGIKKYQLHPTPSCDHEGTILIPNFQKSI